MVELTTPWSQVVRSKAKKLRQTGEQKATEAAPATATAEREIRRSREGKKANKKPVKILMESDRSSYSEILRKLKDG